MGDLRTHTARMRELLQHLAEREAVFDHFYCDHVGLVTIAIGYLVDHRGARDAVGRGLARTLAGRRDVTFRDKSGRPASPTDVEDDWQRVKNHGRAVRGVGAFKFRGIAQLRIDKTSVDAITTTVVRNFLDQLYLKRPFVLGYDARVAMALVDVRYNAAGIALYGGSADIQRFWNALNPSHKSFSPSEAMVLFERIWATRGKERYGVRHYMRARWMREGLQAMQPEAPISVPNL